MNGRRLSAGLWVFLAALLLRGTWVLLAWNQSGPALAYPDEQLHWQLATNLAHDGRLASDDGRYAVRMPLYPLLLALFAGGGSGGVLAARLVQALLGATTAWVLYRWAGMALGARSALVAGLLVAFDPYAIFFCNLLLNEALFTFIAVAFGGLAWRLAGRPDASREPFGRRFSRGPALFSPRGVAAAQKDAAAESLRGVVSPAAAGIALLGAAAVLTRPEALLWVVLTWIVLWLADPHTGRATRRFGLYAAVLFAALVPWAIRNRIVLGQTVWLSTNGGVTLYDGQGPQADGSSNQQFLAEMPELNELDEVQRDRALHRAAVRRMREDVGRAAWLALVKFARTWNPIPNVAEYRRGPAAWVSALFTSGVLIAAAVGFWRRRRQPTFLVMTLLPVVVMTAICCIFIGSLRYRVPQMPFVELLAAAAAQPAPRTRDPLHPSGLLEL